MSKLLKSLIIVLGLLFVPSLAEAANRFAVCTTTCTWDNTSTAMWSTSSGGATGASAPVAADDVILDAATCVGGTTCTITTFAGTISINTLTMGACTASTSGCILEGSTNNTNFTFAGTTGYNNNASGTRTHNMGSGTYTVSNNLGSWTINASATLNAGTSTIAFTGTAGNASRRFTGGGKTYATVDVTSGASAFIVTGANTFGTFTVTPGVAGKIIFVEAITQTITTFTNVSASASAPVSFMQNNPTNGSATISSANNWTCDFCAIGGMTFSGGGTFSATNSFNLNLNSGITISAPTVGGGGGRIIGG